MNPTVMVMTAGAARAPFNKVLISGMASREATSEPDHDIVIINSRKDYHPEGHYRNTSLNNNDNYMDDIGTHYTRIN